jgi:hypothetical protein
MIRSRNEASRIFAAPTRLLAWSWSGLPPRRSQLLRASGKQPTTAAASLWAARGAGRNHEPALRVLAV